MHENKSFLHIHLIQNIKQLPCINTVQIIRIAAVTVNDSPQILALLLSFVFLSGFIQVRFNFIDDVISLYEVG